MRVMFISDIHGIKTNLKIIKEEFAKRQCDKLVLLGDLLYIGPRNEMSEDYNIREVLSFLNSMKDKIIAIQGNCDSEVDEIVCEFPIVKELGVLSVDGKDLYLTHGHIYHENNWKYENSILIYGHYHVPFIKEKGKNLFLNPGSISLPKENNQPSYMIYENMKFTIYDILGDVIAEKRI